VLALLVSKEDVEGVAIEGVKQEVDIGCGCEDVFYANSEASKCVDGKSGYMGIVEYTGHRCCSV
jgi:hypothetical protein